MIIQEFYENCELFITGGSGVVGKALIDKLLRSCNVKRIYVLLRPKRGLDADQRLEKLKNAKIFRLLRNTNIDALNKLTAIAGDAVLPNLGICEEDLKIMENVSCIFHCAATVSFNEPLRWALKLNVAGTLETLKFAMKLKKIKVFMHVSTFFSNPYLTYVEPKVYPAPMDWRLCLKIMENEHDEETFNILTKKMVTGFANTYTFTKNLAEAMVNDYRDRLPVSIYRPSIVLFAFEDPEPGFPPSLVGAMGLFALVGSGLLKCVYLADNVRLDITPQDLGIFSMLYYGYKSRETYKAGMPSEVPVYIFSSSKLNPFSFKHMGETVERTKMWEETAYMKSLLLPGSVYTSNYWRYYFSVITSQILPAVIVDTILLLMGRKPELMSIVRKCFITLKVMEPFVFNDYDSPGVTYGDIMERDFYGTEFDFGRSWKDSGKQEVLNGNIRKMTYKLREILMNEDPRTLPMARKILKVKKFIYNIVRAIFYYYLLRWIYSIVLQYISF